MTTNDFTLNSFRSGLILFFYRILNNLYNNKNIIFSKVLLKFLNVIWEILKIILNINCQISYRSSIGKNIRLLHIGDGVVISAKANIGDNVTIYHQVTLGINEFLPADKQSINVGDGCYLSTGSKIISCTLGKNVKVGPNAVVFKDIEDNGKVFSDNTIR